MVLHDRLRIYVDDVRTSQEIHIWTSTARSLTFIFHFIKSKKKTWLIVL
jgi:hypothetical protein